MAWREDAEEGFPPQRHREPLSLRQDILDELSDHLALAAEREAEAGAESDEEIRTRVLGKFGSPTAIARSLWWGAMKGTVMKDWIQISFNAILCIGVMVFMVLFYQQMQSSNNALLTALKDQGTGSVSQDPSVELVLYRGSLDGPIVKELKVELTGHAFGRNDDRSDSITAYSDQQGKVKFGPIRAGQYSINIQDDLINMHTYKKITLYADGKTTPLKIVLPPDKKHTLNAVLPFDTDILSDKVMVVMDLSTKWNNDDMDWWLNNGFPENYSQKSYRVVATSEGLFNIRNSAVNNSYFQKADKINLIYGNTLVCRNVTLAEQKNEDDLKGDWFININTSPLGSSTTFEFNSHNDEVLRLEFPEALLDTYKLRARHMLNQNHGLPERFSWFPEQITYRFPEYIIDKAYLVEESAFYTHSLSKDQYSLIVDSSPPIMKSNLQLYSLKNAPKQLADGYKLLLAFNDTKMSFDDLTIFNPQLNAFWDTSTIPYKDRAPSGPRRSTSSPDPTPYSIGDPIWTIDTVTIEQNWKRGAYIDLTDAVNNTEDFTSATGILFQWEQSVNNKLSLPNPEKTNIHRQPVWIVLKPFGGSKQKLVTTMPKDPLRQLVNLDFKEMPIERVADLLLEKSGLDVEIDPDTDISGTVTANLDDTSLGGAIDVVFRMNGLVLVETEAGGYRLFSRSDAEAQGLNMEMAFLYPQDPMLELIDVQYTDMDLAMAISKFTAGTDLNIISKFEIDGRVTCDLKGVARGQAIEIMLHMNGLGLIKEGGVYRIAEEDEAIASRDGAERLFQ